MMGTSQPQPNLFHTVQLEDLVPEDHPLRKIRPLVDTRRLRFETLFDDTVRRAAKEGWVSDHWSMDGTLTRANASQKSFVPIELHQSPERFREVMSGKKKAERRGGQDDDKGNPSVDWRGEKRSNKTHRSTTDPDARIATKSNKEPAVPGYTVNGVMENRNRILMGMGVEVFRGPASEREGGLCWLDRVKNRLRLRPKTLGADKGFFEKKFIKALFRRRIEPHVAAMDRGRAPAHARVRRLG